MRVIDSQVCVDIQIRTADPKKRATTGIGSSTQGWMKQAVQIEAQVLATISIRNCSHQLVLPMQQGG